MKRNLLLCLCFLALCSCARFTTKQADVSPERTITTKAMAWTFFESSSKLSSFKAVQTDKSQAATVGSLDQSASGTNVVAALNVIATIIDKIK